MTVITVANQKGGAGKSTTATTLAAGLHAKGHKTLIIDMDAQGNATVIAGANAGEDASAYDVLTNNIPANKAIVAAGNFGDIIPATTKLARVERELVDEMDRFTRLKKALKKINYDFVIIDTPPSMGTLTINALTASSGVIIPTGADKLGIVGIRQLCGTINSVRENTNPNLIIYGILLTRHDPRRLLFKDYTEGLAELAKEMGTRVFRGHIRDNTAIREAQAYGETIFDYSPKCNSAEDYTAFIKEFTSIIKRGKR